MNSSFYDPVDLCDRMEPQRNTRWPDTKRIARKAVPLPTTDARM